MDKDHVVLDSTLESDFKTIMNNVTDHVRKDYPEQSFKRIFWEQQLQIANATNSRQIRWHPAIIKFCLHLKFISSGAYHALRNGGVITLPSERTLRDYTNWMHPGVGFLPQVDAHIAKEASITEEKDRFTILIWDEMKIKDDFIFNKHTCELVGFTNIFDVNSQLDKVEQQLVQSSSPHRKLATRAAFSCPRVVVELGVSLCSFCNNRCDSRLPVPYSLGGSTTLGMCWFECPCFLL